MECNLTLRQIFTPTPFTCSLILIDTGILTAMRLISQRTLHLDICMQQLFGLHRYTMIILLSKYELLLPFVFGVKGVT